MRYFLGNNGIPLIYTEIGLDDYNLWIEFYKKYKKFQDLAISYLIATDVQYEMNAFLDKIMIEKNEDITLLHNRATSQFSKYVIMNRLFIDNCKYFCNELSVPRSIVNDLDWTCNGFLVKCLRDYAQHRSLPMTNTKIKYDVINEKKKIQFTISKKELLQNSFKGKQLEKLKKLTMDEIILNDLVKPYNDEIERLFINLTQEFLIRTNDSFCEYIHLNKELLNIIYEERKIDTIYRKDSDDFVDRVYKCDEKILHFTLYQLMNR